MILALTTTLQLSRGNIETARIRMSNRREGWLPSSEESLNRAAYFDLPKRSVYLKSRKPPKRAAPRSKSLRMMYEESPNSLCARSANPNAVKPAATRKTNAFIFRRVGPRMMQSCNIHLAASIWKRCASRQPLFRYFGSCGLCTLSYRVSRRHCRSDCVTERLCNQSGIDGC